MTPCKTNKLGNMFLVSLPQSLIGILPQDESECITIGASGCLTGQGRSEFPDLVKMYCHPGGDCHPGEVNPSYISI